MRGVFGSSVFSVLLSLLLLSLIIFTFSGSAQSSEDDSNSEEPELDPEFDQLNITEYLLNDRLLKFQLKCVLMDGPCDIVGKWIKGTSVRLNNKLILGKTLH